MTVITNINMGRALTTAEHDARATALTNAIAENVVYAYGQSSSKFASIAWGNNFEQEIIIWATTDSADAYVAEFNAFDPPPVSATVQTI